MAQITDEAFAVTPGNGEDLVSDLHVGMLIKRVRGIMDNVTMVEAGTNSPTTEKDTIGDRNSEITICL